MNISNQFGAGSPKSSHDRRGAGDADPPGRRRLVAGRVFDGDRMLSPGWVSIQNGRVEHLSSGVPADCAVDEVRPDLILAPGLVDTHAHGADGMSFGEKPDEALATVATHREHGTTSMFASLVSAPRATLAAQLRSLAPLVHGQSLAGVHLEGPWLSAAFRGAHQLQYLTAPSASDLEELLDAADGTLRMVTIAPELPDALAVIRRLRDAGVAPAIGHTGCSYDQATQAIRYGARVATHLFNAMPTLHHRNPGPVAAMLEGDDTRLEIIADGIHVHDAVLRWLFAQAADQVVLVSDAMAAAGLGDGIYDLGGQRVAVSGGRADLDGTTTLAGSAFTLHDMVRHAVQVAGVDLAQALRAATSVPARTHHLEAGHLSAGVPANVLVMNRNLDVVEVIYRGRPVVRRDRTSSGSRLVEPQLGSGAGGPHGADLPPTGGTPPWK